MSWIKIDDQFADHPKIVAAGPLAGWLHICALCYCGRYLTDGFIPDAIIPRLADFSDVNGAQDETVPLAKGKQNFSNGLADCLALARRLLDTGLWIATDGGYQIHDYLEYNPSKEQALAAKKARIEAGRRGGLAKEAKRKQTPSKPPSKSLAKPKQKSAPSPSPSPSIPTVAGKPAVADGETPKPKTEMMNAFLEVTNLSMPIDKPTIKYWWSQMHILYKLAGEDVDRGKRLIKDTVAQMQAGQLTIGGPESIIKIARSIMAEGDGAGEAIRL